MPPSPKPRRSGRDNGTPPRRDKIGVVKQDTGARLLAQLWPLKLQHSFGERTLKLPCGTSALGQKHTWVLCISRFI
jgi:hypothetical protein